MSAAGNIPESVMEDAVGWFDDLRSGATVDREQLATWLRRSPTHVEAFLTVATLHDGLSAAVSYDRAWLESLLAEEPSNVWPLVDQVADRHAEAPARPPSRRAWRWTGIAAVLLVAASTATLTTLSWLPLDGDSGERQRYVTQLGEQRAVVLADGSVLHLNTDSTVEIRFTADSRDVLLERGEAMFDVKKDAARPFRVLSDGITIKAIGTRFNVYYQPRETVVTVIEGRVAVQSAPSGRADRDAAVPEPAVPPTASQSASAGRVAMVELDAGQQLALRRDGSVAQLPVPVDTAHTTAWTQRRVVFEDDTLATVIKEFNRYNRRKLVIEDPALRARRISGIFTVDDPEVFAEVLGSMTPIRTIEHRDGSLEIVSAPGAAVPQQRD